MFWSIEITANNINGLICCCHIFHSHIYNIVDITQSSINIFIPTKKKSNLCHLMMFHGKFQSMRKKNFFYLPQMKNFNLLLSGFPQVVSLSNIIFSKSREAHTIICIQKQKKRMKNNLWRFLCDDFYAHKKIYFISHDI